MQPDNKNQLENTEYVFDRRLIDEDHHDAGGHGTEMGWLVSYADMMTLLFGLFVLLFVMASEKKGDVEKNMKELSEKFFSSENVKPIEKTNPVEKTIPESTVTLQTTELELQITKLSEELKNLVSEKNEIEKKYQESAEVQSRLQAEIETLKSQNQIPAPTTDQTALVQQLKMQIAQMRKIPDQSATVAELNKSIEELNNSLEDLKKQNEILQQRSIASIEKNYMMISATWATEKHDVDLVIIDPNGFKYNFKNKRGPQSIGQFEIDSRYGPGLELWKTEELKPGKYKAVVSLYNQYGNTKDAEVKIHIVTSKQSQYLKNAILNSTHKTETYEFNIDQQGMISAN